MNEKRLDIVKYCSIKDLCFDNGLCMDQIIGTLDENNNEHDAIRIPDRGFVYGITYYNVGIKPQIEMWKDEHALLIGFDRILVYINLVDGNIKFCFKLPSLFYEYNMVTVTDKSTIVIICELDVCALDTSGKELWSVGFRDIITDFNIINDEIHIKCDDGDEVMLSMADGQIG